MPQQPIQYELLFATSCFFFFSIYQFESEHRKNDNFSSLSHSISLLLLQHALGWEWKKINKHLKQRSPRLPQNLPSLLNLKLLYSLVLIFCSLWMHTLLHLEPRIANKSVSSAGSFQPGSGCSPGLTVGEQKPGCTNAQTRQTAPQFCRSRSCGKQQRLGLFDSRHCSSDEPDPVFYAAKKDPATEGTASLSRCEFFFLNVYILTLILNCIF